MAGGGGTRLWPLSRESKPKQFCKITGDETLFEETVGRFLKYYPPTDIFVCLNEKLAPQAKELVPIIPAENYIIEPEKRDTAPAMGLAAVKLLKNFPDEPIAFIPSDHYIADRQKFMKIIQHSEIIIRQTGKMLDIGVMPQFPSTVLGYTKIGEPSDRSNGIDIFEFLGHTEKPDFETAKKYIESGEYLWHASYYMWTPRKIIEAFEKYSPAHHSSLMKIFNAQNAEEERAAFSEMTKIAFDYAVTEKISPSDVLIIKADFGWSDVGAFDVLYEAQKRQSDESGNVVFADWEGADTSNCLIYGETGKKIATIGVDDLAIIDTSDALLVCRKSKAQEVKKIVEKLKNKNQNNYL